MRYSLLLLFGAALLTMAGCAHNDHRGGGDLGLQGEITGFGDYREDADFRGYGGYSRYGDYSGHGDYGDYQSYLYPDYGR